MYYVYALLSLTNGDMYIGYSEDLRDRVREHNDLKVRSTKGNVPWKLVYYEAYLNKKDASIREKKLKEHKAKDDLKERLINSIDMARW